MEAFRVSIGPVKSAVDRSEELLVAVTAGAPWMRFAIERAHQKFSVDKIRSTMEPVDAGAKRSRAHR